MIENDEQLEVTYQQLGRMYRALAELRREVRPVNPRNCDVFAEGFVDQIRALQREIDEYLGLDQSAQAEVRTAPSETVGAMRETPPPYRPKDS